MKTELISTIAGGIGPEMFFWAFIGSVIHIMFKWINAINEKHKQKEEFHFINWIGEAAPMMIFSILCGLVTVFGVSQYWSPINITKSIISGLLAGSAIFNVLPAVTNGDMWASIGQWLVNKFKPKP